MRFIILLFTIVFIVWPIIAFVKMDKDVWIKELMVCGGTIGKKLFCKLDRERNMCGTYHHSEVPPMPDNTLDNSNTADEGNTDMK